ncbi:hypothetical protein PPTG_23452 [Phytophthora nicotianae INRA-310]|uniref:Uncharacterized protein n=2 Tax=Phytophthora nicotianae TaxID=4792 RepID=W2Q035_PHYN3|nr:hypothetical protein PPTG_23452 [Phytophthora nicotianae INRA-310]ETN05869.1 hypothetical protein PPTG_23452 [Phytophthora nicotianae INRA-310]
MHKEVKAKRTRRSERYRKRPHHEHKVNFSAGNYVLRPRVDEKLHANNLKVMWVEPYRIMASANYFLL